MFGFSLTPKLGLKSGLSWWIKLFVRSDSQLTTSCVLSVVSKTMYLELIAFARKFKF